MFNRVKGLRNWMYSLVVQCCRLGTCFVCLFWLFVIIFKYRIGGRVEMVKMKFKLVDMC